MQQWNVAKISEPLTAKCQGKETIPWERGGNTYHRLSMMILMWTIK